MSPRHPQQSFKFLLLLILFLGCAASPASSTALAQSYVFGTGSFAVTGYAPGAMAAADFNHDGKLDLAVANQGSSGTVSVLLGNPNGSFAAAVDYSVGPLAPTGITAGDFNGDGNPDLAVAAQSPETIEIFLGKGDGTFQAPTSFQVTSVTNLGGLVSGDFNHDGKIDLALANTFFSAGQVTILLGNGDGAFQPGVDYPTAGSQSIVAADFNNDGNLDLAVGSQYLTTGAVVSVLLGNGNGTFKAYASFSVSGFGTVQVTAGDLNGDGKPDLVAATATTAGAEVDVLIGNGDGTFQAAVTYSDPLPTNVTEGIAIGDFDGDQIRDIAAANNSGNNVSIFRGNGDGTFQTAVHYGAGIGPEQVIVGDFNSDGHLDMAASGGYFTGYVTVVLGMGGGTFTTWTDYPVAAPPAYSSVTGDFNGDGSLDVATMGFTTSGSVSVLPGKGDGTFQNHVDTPVGSGPSYSAAADFNRDGKLDLVVANTEPVMGNGRLSVLLGKGDGTFLDVNDIPIASLAGNIAVADFNNDGNPDFATVQQVTNAASVFLGNGDGNFAKEIQVPISTNQSYGSIFTADFNKDGKADLAASINGGAISILLGNGDGSFQPATNAFTGDSLVAVGDFNSDGKPDLVLTPSAAALDVALGNGDGTFQAVSASTFMPSILEVDSPITGDFNGDGKLDLAFSSSSEMVVSVLLGNGDGTFGNLIDYLAENGPRPPVAGDFNDDGSLDLAVPIVSPNGIGNISVFLSSPIVALDPGMLSFADQPVGTPSTAQSVMLFNSSGTPLSIAGISTNGDFSETDTCGTKLAPSANCEVSVAFTPSGGGMRSGVVTVDDNAPGSPQIVALYGTGSLPTASVSPASLSFSVADVGTTSAAQGVTLTNTSSAVLTISSITTSGDFAQTNNCGGARTGGGSCTISVTFTPTAAGSRSGRLSITDDAANSPQTAALSGSGEDFTLAVASGSSSSATVSAGGTASYMLTLSPEAGFNAAVSLSCSGAPPNATCSVSPATLDRSKPATVKVTVTTATGSVLPSPESPAPFSGPWPEVLLGALGLVGTVLLRSGGPRSKRRRSLRWAILTGTLAFVMSLTACGGGGGGGGGGTSPTTPGTPAGTYMLNVTGTSGNLSHSTQLTLKVK
ncbi:MAG TPA: FG-GAP-like repeat-containing protein [Terriglobia bacterium]|nr:FG-GAP-like repeat-containing protein [Terriglobia bacterium]